MSFNSIHKEYVLSFGDFKVHFDGSSLRYMSHGKTELIRRVYFAVRDKDWLTVPCIIKNHHIKKEPEGFSISFDAICKDGDIDFRWECKITGRNNSIRFDILGKAFTSFDANRIGFCLLHPLDGHRGKEITVQHTNGNLTNHNFPEYIAPHQPIKDIIALRSTVNSVDIFIQFDGEVFEMEDQRNWLDASFKTYCTPLSLPFPKRYEIGKKVEQSIFINLSASKPSSENYENYEVQLLKDERFLPKIGLDFPNFEFSDWTIDKLKELNLSHLRIEIRIDEDNWSYNFHQKVKQVKRIDVGIELVIISQNLPAYLTSQLMLFDWQLFSIISVLFLSSDNKVPDNATLSSIIPILKENFINVPIGTGTNAYFTELNRAWPVFKSLDFCSFSVNPQVHAYDNATILETPVVIKDIINTIRNRNNELSIHFSPVTLSPRIEWNKKENNLDQCKFMDSRQGTTFNSLWCWSMVKYLSENSSDLVTINSIDGHHGILNQEEKFTYPIYELFRVLGRHKRSKIVASLSSEPLIYESLIFDNGVKKEAILLNFSNQEITISIMEKLIVLNAKSFKVVLMD